MEAEIYLKSKEIEPADDMSERVNAPEGVSSKRVDEDVEADKSNKIRRVITYVKKRKMANVEKDCMEITRVELYAAESPGLLTIHIATSILLPNTRKLASELESDAKGIVPKVRNTNCCLNPLVLYLC